MAHDMQQREVKLAQMVEESFQPPRKVLTAQEAEGFLQRLFEDAAKRQAKRYGVGGGGVVGGCVCLRDDCVWSHRDALAAQACE